MKAKQFIAEWKDKKDVTDDSFAVGIGVNWDKIDTTTSKVEQYFGFEAWKQIENYYAPVWGGFKRTKMGAWLNISRPDYQKFIDEESGVGKIELYRQNGLIYPDFCALADIHSGLGVLGDGCHRFIDCNYLILVEGVDMRKTIAKCRLDVLLVSNLLEVLNTSDYPPELIP